MPSRVNTKFIFLLGSILVVLIGAGTAVYFKVVKPRAEVNITRGDEMMANGDYLGASKVFHRATRRYPNNADVVVKFADAFKNIPVQDSRTAQTRIKEVVEIYRHALDLEPTNKMAVQGLANLYIKIGRDLHDIDGWNQLYTFTDTLILTNPTFQLAKKYRGIAQASRMQLVDLSQKEQAQAKKDLSKAYEMNPKDVETAYYLALIYVAKIKADRRNIGRLSKTTSDETVALQLLTDAIKANPSDLQARLNTLSVLYDLKHYRQVSQLLEQLEHDWANVKIKSPRVVLELAKYAVRNRTGRDNNDMLSTKESAVVRAERILHKGLETFPNNLQLKVMLGQMLVIEKKFDEAQTAFSEAAELPIEAEPVLAFVYVRLRQAAKMQQIDIRIRKLTMNNQTLNSEELEGIEKELAEIRLISGDSAYVNLLEGRIYMARKQWGQSLVKLDRASHLFNDTHPDILLLSANACVKLGELGAAVQRMESLMRIRPNYMPARYDLIRLYLRLELLEKAKLEISRVLHDDSNNAEGLKFAAELEARLGYPARAVVFYRKLNLKENPEIRVPFAKVLANSGESAKAVAMLDQVFREKTGNVTVLKELIHIVPDTKKVDEYIQLAEKSGVSKQLITILESKRENLNDDQIAQAIEILLASEKDPIQRLIGQYQLYRQTDETEKKQAVLTEMAQLKKLDPQVIGIQFAEAINKRDWEEARKLAHKAAQANTDLAGGLFFLGRLALAQGQATKAVTLFRKALTKRAVYSDGWMMLGGALRRIGDTAAAIEAFKQSIRQRPNNYEANRLIAMAYDSFGDHLAALAEFRKIIQRNATSEMLREQYLNYEQLHGDRERVLKIRSQQAIARPKDYVNRRGLVVLLALMKKMDQAKQQLQLLFKEDGRNRANISVATSLYSIAGDQVRARQMIESYIKKKGAKVEPEDWLIMGRFELTDNRFKQADIAYYKGIALDPDSQMPIAREWADRLFELGKTDEAFLLYQKIWQANLTDTRVRQRYIEALIRNKHFAKARKILEKVMLEEGRNANNLLLSAMIFQEEGHAQQALKLLDESQKMAPERAAIYFERAKTLQGMKNVIVRDVVDNLRTALELNPNMQSARQLMVKVLVTREAPEQTIRELHDLINRYPQDVAMRMQLLQVLMDQNDLLDAQSLLSDTRRYFPNEPRWIQLQADLAMRQENHKQAARYLQELFALKPYPQVLASLLIQLILDRQVEHASQWLKHQDPMVYHDPILLAIKGRVAMLTDQMLKSKELFQLAVKKCDRLEQLYAVAMHLVAVVGVTGMQKILEPMATPKNEAWLQMVFARQEMLVGRYDDAAQRLLDHRKMVLGKLAIQYDALLGLAFHRSGNHQKAVAIYQAVLKKAPDNLTALNNLAYLYTQKLKKYKEALQLASHAASIKPYDPQILDTLGVSQFYYGMIEQSIKTLKRSVRIKSMASNHYHLGQAVMRLGDNAYAEKQLTTALVLAERNDDTKLIGAIQRDMEKIKKHEKRY